MFAKRYEPRKTLADENGTAVWLALALGGRGCRRCRAPSFSRAASASSRVLKGPTCTRASIVDGMPLRVSLARNSRRVGHRRRPCLHGIAGRTGAVAAPGALFAAAGAAAGCGRDSAGEAASLPREGTATRCLRPGLRRHARSRAPGGHLPLRIARRQFRLRRDDRLWRSIDDRATVGAGAATGTGLRLPPLSGLQGVAEGQGSTFLTGCETSSSERVPVTRRSGRWQPVPRPAGPGSR